MARGSSESSLTVKATLALRELLLKGEFGPGERVAELALVERLGASRTPLRVALLRLEHEGLLEMLPGGGFVVREFTLDDIVDAIELRGVLEGTAARFAAERLDSPDELDGLRECTAELAEVVHAEGEASLERYLELNERFHGRLHVLAKSPGLSRALANVLALPFAAPNALLPAHGELPESREILVIAQYQHQGILESIAAGHGARAEEIAREHARVAYRNLALVLEHRELLERVPGGPLLAKPL
jgi:GntR family transcriptional regulator of vanillate catabolism